MSEYKYDSSHTAKSYTKTKTAKTEIVIHHWGKDGQSHDGVVRWFEGAGTSAHYVISAGRVSCLVDPSHIAWHAGNWEVNKRSYGLECRPEMSAGDLETVAQVIADIWKSHKKKLPITYHKKYKATACPGRYMNKLNWLRERATEIYEGKPAAKKFYTVKNGDTLSGIAKTQKSTVAKLMKLNPEIKDADKISTGQKIRIK